MEFWDEKIIGRFTNGQCSSIVFNFDYIVGRTLHHDSYRPMIVKLLREEKNKLLPENDIISTLVITDNPWHQEDYSRYVRETLEFMIQDKVLIRFPDSKNKNPTYSLAESFV
jgi:hypothetical protein